MEKDDSLSNGSSRGVDTTNRTNGDGSTTIVIREMHPAYKSRFAMVFSIVICTVVAVVTIFTVAVRGDIKSFELAYETKVANIFDLVQWKVQHYMSLTEQVSASVTVVANTSDATFPFLTSNNYEIAAGYARGQSGMRAVGYAPFVSRDERLQWEDYATNHQDWLAESHFLEELHPEFNDPLHGYRRHLEAEEITPVIFRWSGPTRITEDDIASAEFYAPLWHISPPSDYAINLNLFSDPLLRKLASKVVQSKKTVMSQALLLEEINGILFSQDTRSSGFEGRSGHAYFFLMSPVFDSFHDDKVVGVVFSVSSLSTFLDHTIPSTVKGVVAVVRDSCSRDYTFLLNGNGGETVELAANDTHDPKYDKYEVRGDLDASPEHDLTADLCTFNLSVYPSDIFRQRFSSKDGASIKVGAVIIGFLCCAIILYCYDKKVTKQHEETTKKARRTEQLVGTLFPEAVRARILEQENDDSSHENDTKERPIADFFPNTTLMFADIVGFTAWSSVRDPIQVFELLETIYGEFDALAKKRRVFKVETVGDCYVAACGLPKPRKDHAVTMARFARDCLLTMNELGPRLEASLGPETSALTFRIGCHSGPVTAGVLRADNARYQIFGDTVNTAARMEHTGLPDRIQVSSTMANMLIDAGKGHWVAPRDETVVAKGKGEMQTYWLLVDKDNNSNDETTSCSSIGFDIIEMETAENGKDGQGVASVLPQKTLRLIDWNTDILFRLINKVVTRRNHLVRRLSLHSKAMKSARWNECASTNNTVLSEVEEIIHLPPALTYKEDSEEQTEIDEVVYGELHKYVTEIARHYRDNAFHSFDHASHVAMSVVKMMGRIVAPQSQSTGDVTALHTETYGITSDPLTQFACVFSALIHDCDHPGVPNSQLAKEDESLCKKYKGQSLAEQRSVDLAWALLLDDKYQNLRKVLCVDTSELKRFRQLLVNSVMATDVMDKQLKELRNNRWQKAFSESTFNESPDDTLHRKATIVIEHLIQASDISHTMQHWHVYRKWNEKLFREMYDAFLAGRSDTDPYENWYKGEIGFFDYYVIPLARKLKDCGVFGVSSDEYLSYAQANREEWASKGQKLVDEMMAKIRKEKSIEKDANEAFMNPEKKPTGVQKMLRRLSSSASVRNLMRRTSGLDEEDEKPQPRRMSGMSRSASQRSLLLRNASKRRLANPEDDENRRLSISAQVQAEGFEVSAKPMMNRTASMRALMKKVWDESDVLESPQQQPARRAPYSRATSDLSSSMRFT